MYVSAPVRNYHQSLNAKQKHFGAIEMSSRARDLVFAKVENLNSLKAIANMINAHKQEPANIFIHAVGDRSKANLVAHYNGKFVTQGEKESVLTFFKNLTKKNLSSKILVGLDNCLYGKNDRVARPLVEASIKENSQTLPPEVLIKIFSGGY